MGQVLCNVFCFFFQAEDGIRDVAVTGVQTCALPISAGLRISDPRMWDNRQDKVTFWWLTILGRLKAERPILDRKSTRLNSSHGYISYAVFCLKKKRKKISSVEL